MPSVSSEERIRTIALAYKYYFPILELYLFIFHFFGEQVQKENFRKFLHGNTANELRVGSSVVNVISQFWDVEEQTSLQNLYIYYDNEHSKRFIKGESARTDHLVTCE